MLLLEYVLGIMWDKVVTNLVTFLWVIVLAPFEAPSPIEVYLILFGPIFMHGFIGI
jgi:hypothetical protein